MKRTSFLILSFLFLATTFKGDRLTGWVQQTIPRPDLAVRDLQFVDSLTGFMVSDSGTDTAFIFKTTNGGENWITTYFENLYLTCLDFPNKSTGYCAGSTVGSGIIKKTTDGGNNWFTVSFIAFTLFRDIEFVNKDTGWVCFDSPVSGALWRTTNGGQSWQLQLNYNYSPSKIFFVNSNTGWVIGNSGINLYKTTNSGVNWFLQANIGNASITDVFFATQDTGWIIGGQSNGIMRTTNGGNNWHTVNNPPLPYETRLFFLTNTLGWAGSGPNKIIASKDGYNWGTQYSPRFTSYNVCFVDSLHGWAGYSGLAKTTDGGGPITYTGITRNGDFIPSFELGQNYPNPFNASTRIKFSVLKPSYIELKIFNISGREAARLITGQQYNPGEYDFYFDAGKYSLTSGIYFYLMRGATTDNKEIFIDTKKLMLIK